MLFPQLLFLRVEHCQYPNGAREYPPNVTKAKQGLHAAIELRLGIAGGTLSLDLARQFVYETEEWYHARTKRFPIIEVCTQASRILAFTGFLV